MPEGLKIGIVGTITILALSLCGGDCESFAELVFVSVCSLVVFASGMFFIAKILNEGKNENSKRIRE